MSDVTPANPVSKPKLTREQREELRDEQELIAETIGETPGLLALLHPMHYVHWMWALIECWFFSRDYGRLKYGAPCILTLIGSVGFVFWLKASPDDVLLSAYEAAVERTAAENDDARHENYLRALVSLRPSEPRYRFQLGEFLVRTDRRDGLGQILALAPEQTDGYLPARMWLVNQASKPNPIMPLTMEQIEGQLLKVIRQTPDHQEARIKLAQIYSRKGDWKLAEEHLAQAAAANPDCCIDLARMKMNLKRPPADIEALLKRGAEEYLRRLTQQPDDSAIRIALAEAQLLNNQAEEARALLQSGLTRKEDPVLRRALSDFDVAAARRRANESALNFDSSAQLVLNALQTDPTNPMAIVELAQLHSMGAAVPAESLAPALEVWKAEFESDPQDDEKRVHFAQLQAMSGNDATTVELLQPLLATRPELRRHVARHLQRSGQPEEASRILNETIEDLRKSLAAASDDHVRRRELVEALIAAGRSEEALQILRASPTREGSSIPSDPDLCRQFGRVCLLMYDHEIPFDREISVAPDFTTSDADRLFRLLRDAIASGFSAAPAIDRLARLSFSQHPAASAAGELVTELRSMGDPQGQILTIMGTRAVLSGRYAEAIKWLELANSQTRESDPMIQNNLAIALIRGNSGQLTRAFDLVDRAIRQLPENPDLLSTKAEIYVAMRRWPEALAELNRALPQRRNSIVVHQLLEQVYTEMNELEMARRHRETLATLKSTAD